MSRLTWTVTTAAERDVLITATPMFRGSYPAMFEYFFDLIDHYALANKLR